MEYCEKSNNATLIEAFGSADPNDIPENRINTLTGLSIDLELENCSLQEELEKV